MLVQRIHFYN